MDSQEHYVEYAFQWAFYHTKLVIDDLNPPLAFVEHISRKNSKISRISKSRNYDRLMVFIGLQTCIFIIKPVVHLIEIYQEPSAAIPYSLFLDNRPCLSSSSS